MYSPSPAPLLQHITLINSMADSLHKNRWSKNSSAMGSVWCHPPCCFSQSIIIIESVYNSGKHTWSKYVLLVWKQPPEIYLTVITTQIAEWQYPPAQTLKINKQQKQNQAWCTLGVNLAEALPFIKAALRYWSMCIVLFLLPIYGIWIVTGIRFYDFKLGMSKFVMRHNNNLEWCILVCKLDLRRFPWNKYCGNGLSNLFVPYWCFSQ